MFLNLIKQDLLINFKNIAQVIHSLAFFIISLTTFAINLHNINRDIAIIVIWLCLLFAILLFVNNLFQNDFDDGTLEQLFLGNNCFELIILAKIISVWISGCLPLVAILPLAAIFLNITSDYKYLLIISPILALIISFIVAFASSLTLSNNKTIFLTTILVFPLSLPAIIFANIALMGDFISAAIMLAAILLFLGPIFLLLTSVAIKSQI